jgi:hypothetical protein
MTHDGLYPVRNTLVDLAWARQDLDLTGYNKVIVQGAGIQYRPVKARGGSRLTVRSDNKFPISEENKARLRRELTIAFTEALAKGENFEVVTTPGPDVLIVRAGLLDVVSFVPPERMGRYDVYLDRVGEATLVLELVDAESGAVLVRAVDRRAAEQTGMVLESNSVSNWAEVKRLGRTWARLLLENLDSLAANLDIGSGT